MLFAGCNIFGCNSSLLWLNAPESSSNGLKHMQTITTASEALHHSVVDSHSNILQSANNVVSAHAAEGFVTECKAVSAKCQQPSCPFMTTHAPQCAISIYIYVAWYKAVLHSAVVPSYSSSDGIRCIMANVAKVGNMLMCLLHPKWLCPAWLHMWIG